MQNSIGDWAHLEPLVVDPPEDHGGSGPDFRAIQVANDDDTLYLRYTSEHAFNLSGEPSTFSHSIVFIDTDRNEATGYTPRRGVGSEYVVFGRDL